MGNKEFKFGSWFKSLLFPSSGDAPAAGKKIDPAEYRNLGKTPVSKEAPAGAYARYGYAFDRLQMEINRYFTPVNWERVAHFASGILANESKDLLAAGYLGAALVRLHEDKWRGLEIGLTVIHDLMTHYPDDLYPVKARERGRKKAIEWWAEKTVKAMRAGGRPPVSEERAARLASRLTLLENLLNDYFEKPPSLLPLQGYIQSVRESSGGGDGGDAETAAVFQAESAAIAGKRRTVVPTPLVKGPGGLLESEMTRLSLVARHIRERDLTDAAAYQCARIAAWASVVRLPPSKKGKTRIQRPPGHLIQSLALARQEENWHFLINTAEDALGRFVFWLDLNYMVAAALENMGDDYQKAREAVCRETAIFILRLRGVARLGFSDGTPFAGSDAVSWLESIDLGK